MVKIKLLTPIEGFEDEAEFRPAKCGEMFLRDCNSAPTLAIVDFMAYGLVLTPCKQWRPATKQDVIDSLAGIKFPTRVRDSDSDEWTLSKSGLCGYRHNDELPWVTSSFSWAQCEVQR